MKQIIPRTERVPKACITGHALVDRDKPRVGLFTGSIRLIWIVKRRSPASQKTGAWVLTAQVLAVCRALLLVVVVGQPCHNRVSMR